MIIAYLCLYKNQYDVFTYPRKCGKLYIFSYTTRGTVGASRTFIANQGEARKACREYVIDHPRNM